MANDRLLKIGEAARILDVSNDTMRNWDESGKLRAVRNDGNQRRYRLADVVALLPSRTDVA